MCGTQVASISIIASTLAKTMAYPNVAEEWTVELVMAPKRMITLNE
jgi:hypothetical protein